MRILPSLLLAVAFSCAPTVRAETLLDETWEQLANGDLPSKPWSLTIGPYNQGTIAATDQQASPLQGGSKSVKLTGTSAQGGPVLSAALPPVPAKGTVIVEFDYYMSWDEKTGNLPSLVLADSQGTRGLVLNLFSGIPTNGKKIDIVNETASSGMGDIIRKVVMGEWAHVKLEIKTTDGLWASYDATIIAPDGSPAEVKNLKLWRPLGDIARVEFSWASPQAIGVFYIDNVSVSTSAK